MPPLSPDAGDLEPHQPRTLETEQRAPWERFQGAIRTQRDRFAERQERINERSGRNLLFATIVGLVAAAVGLTCLLLAKEAFVGLVLLVVAFAVYELSSAMRTVGYTVPRIPSVAIAVLAIPAVYIGGPLWMWIVLAVGTALLAVWRLISGPARSVREGAPNADKSVIEDFFAAAFVQLYVTFLATFTVMLVAQPRGEWWVLGFIMPVVAIDTGAWASGIKFGRRKLAPRISGGKTWEGLAGGALAGITVSILVSIYLLEMPWWLGVWIGIALVFTATMGDLFESMIKRDLGIKDMSDWLPGHGGLLDRLDSLMPSGAAMFAIHVIVTIGI